MKESLESALLAYAKIHAQEPRKSENNNSQAITWNRYPIAREFLYIPVPKLRAFSYDKPLSWSEKIEFFKSTTLNECQSRLLFAIGKMKVPELISKKEDILTLVDYCDNWWISDSLSSIFSRLLDEDPSLLNTFKKRNTSDNLRKRRQSVVNLYYYSRSRKNPLLFQEAIPFINTLVKDSDYYVQKGVGWSLRELYNLYPEEVFIRLLDHAKILHAWAWQASTEKLPTGDKEKLKLLRKR